MQNKPTAEQRINCTDEIYGNSLPCRLDTNKKIRLIPLRFFVVFIILAISLFDVKLLASENPSDNKAREIPGMNRERMRRTVTKLGGDSLMGRGTGQIGGALAAEYLVKEFKDIGLDMPPGIDNYMQNVQFHEIAVLDNSHLEFYGGGDTIIPELNLDFLVHRTGGAALIAKPVELVFVGYGIDAPEFEYNDYRNINIAGKVAVMFTGEPFSDDVSYFNGELNTKYSYIDEKQRAALAQGARACIIIPNPDHFDYTAWGEMMRAYSFTELALAYSPSDLLTILVRPDIAEHLFRGSGYDYTKLEEMYEKNKLISFALNSSMSFKGHYRDRNFISPNIIGYIRGSDSKLRDTYVLVTAHYDHLGIGAPVRGDSIYNGVLDNAMGVAAVLEIARAFRMLGIKPKRSVVFMLTTAEEKGLLGSIHYVNYPVFPLHKTVANLNIDGVAFIDNFRSIVGVGSQMSDLGRFLENAASKRNLEVEPFPREFKEFESFNRSDQIVYANTGIPAMIVMEGTNYVNVKREYAMLRIMQYMGSIYHTPFDDTGIMVNYDAAMQHTEFLFQLIYDLADSDETPEWAKNTQYYYERIKLINEKR